jgi:hypothetical protein
MIMRDRAASVSLMFVEGRFAIWTEPDDVTRFDQIEISPLM